MLNELRIAIHLTQQQQQHNNNNNTTTTVLWPFVRDYPGELVPEETLTLSEEHTTFNKPLSKTIFSINTLTLCLSTFTTLSTHFSATNIPTPSDLSLPPIQNSLYLLSWVPKSLQPLPHLVSWRHPTSTSLSANASTSSPALPVNESTFQVPTRNPQPFLNLYVALKRTAKVRKEWHKLLRAGSHTPASQQITWMNEKSVITKFYCKQLKILTSSRTRQLHLTFSKRRGSLTRHSYDVITMSQPSWKGHSYKYDHTQSRLFIMYMLSQHQMWRAINWMLILFISVTSVIVKQNKSTHNPNTLRNMSLKTHMLPVMQVSMLVEWYTIVDTGLWGRKPSFKLWGPCRQAASQRHHKVWTPNILTRCQLCHVPNHLHLLTQCRLICQNAPSSQIIHRQQPVDTNQLIVSQRSCY